MGEIIDLLASFFFSVLEKPHIKKQCKLGNRESTNSLGVFPFLSKLFQKGREENQDSPFLTWIAILCVSLCLPVSLYLNSHQL